MSARVLLPEELPQPMSLEEFIEASKPYFEPPPYVSKYGRVRFREIDEPGLEHEFIVDGLMSVGDKSIIGGASMSGKTFLALHLAMAVARGVDFLGFRVLRPGLVVYVAGEGARGLKKRIRAYRKHNGIGPKEDIPFDLLTRKVDLFAADGDTKGLIAECQGIAAERGMPVAMIFLDTFATASGTADENSGKDCATVLGHIDEIERAIGAHISIVHHFNAAGTKLRGHSSLLANIDQVIEVSCNQETKIRTARLAKQKDGEDNVSFKFELMSVEIGRRPDDDKPITSCVVLPVGEKDAARKTEEAKGFRLTAKEELIFKALLTALEKDGRIADAEMEAAGVPAGVLAVDAKSWRREYRRIAVPDANGDPPSADVIRSHWDRRTATMLKWGIIGWSNPWMWRFDRPIRGFPETYSSGSKKRTADTFDNTQGEQIAGIDEVLW